MVDEQEPREPPAGAAEEEERALFGARSGWTLRERFRAPDSYGLLLWLVLLSLFGAAMVDQLGGFGRVVAALFTSLTLLYAIHTSRGGRMAMRVAIGFAILFMVVAVFAARAGGTTGSGGSWAVNAILAATAIVAIGRRLVSHAEVGGQTLVGALCVYLLLGLFYASVYGVMGAWHPPFFTQSPTHSAVTYLYFSYVTMTTVGYGDFTARTDIARMVAVSQALFGQIYLVTVVAVVVSNLGRRRKPRSQGGGSAT
jgi:hypothetical protein